MARLFHFKSFVIQVLRSYLAIEHGLTLTTQQRGSRQSLEPGSFRDYSESAVWNGGTFSPVVFR